MSAGLTGVLALTDPRFFFSLAYRDYLDEIYASFLDRILEVATLRRVKTASAALRTIAETTFSAIIITDEGLSHSNQQAREVLAKIKAYIENGGLVIAGLHFPNFSPKDKFRRFFRSFGLPWSDGDYHRTTFQLNPSGLLPERIGASTLPEPYSMKVLHIKDAGSQEKRYVPTEGALTQSHVFPPMRADETQAAVVGARLGRGYLYYCGDVNWEDGSNQLMLSLCGF
ncbi:Alpha/beta hydrolase family protein [Aspergillus niger]|uniref:Alpha/beta hydrolase family protein n=1 Tax=Aspergillus niger TaxID=5061 RepID=A0A505I3P1_ASPNG|nr:Alpha/beta hydrolase family protein [Aspergillus niger]